jgi:DNA relaxase NicK
MQEITAYLSLQQHSYYYVNVKHFYVNFSKPTRILYCSSVQWSTVETDVTYINKYFKKMSSILSIEKIISNADNCVSYLRYCFYIF